MRAFRIGWRGFDSRRGKRRRRCTGSAAGTPELVDRLDVDRGLLAAAIVLEFIGHALILAKRREPRLLDRGDVHEGVVAAFVGGDEAIALVGVEKFDGDRKSTRLNSSH